MIALHWSLRNSGTSPLQITPLCPLYSKAPQSAWAADLSDFTLTDLPVNSFCFLPKMQNKT